MDGISASVIGGSVVGGARMGAASKQARKHAEGGGRKVEQTSFSITQ